MYKKPRGAELFAYAFLCRRLAAASVFAAAAIHENVQKYDVLAITALFAAAVMTAAAAAEYQEPKNIAAASATVEHL